VLGHYSREIGLFDLETAVRKMTGLSAARFGLGGRGILAEGAYADVTVFDPDTVIDRATFAEPTRPPRHEHVFVNGRSVWNDGNPVANAPAAHCGRQQLQAERW